MKTKEELEEIKKELEALNVKLAELSPEELKQVIGGSVTPEELEKRISAERRDDYRNSSPVNSLLPILLESMDFYRIINDIANGDTPHSSAK